MSNYFKEVYKSLKDEVDDIAKEKDVATRLARYEAFPREESDIYGEMASTARRAKRRFEDMVPMLGTFSPVARHDAASETGLTMRDIKYIAKVDGLLEEIDGRITKDRNKLITTREMEHLKERFKPAAAAAAEEAPPEPAAAAPEAEDLRQRVAELEEMVRDLTEAKPVPPATPAAEAAPHVTRIPEHLRQRSERARAAADAKKAAAATTTAPVADVAPVMAPEPEAPPLEGPGRSIGDWTQMRKMGR